MKRVEIRVEGTFDPDAARALAGKVPAGSASTTVVVDFTKVVKFHDSGLVTLRGVGHHHLRLLRYFGARFSVSNGDPGADEVDDDP